VLSGVLSLLQEWRRCDFRDRAFVALFFIPAMLSVGGLLVYVAWFVLFRLPSFVLGVLGWLLLISIFCGGGLFCCEKLRGGKTWSSSSSSGSYDGTTIFEDPADSKKSGDESHGGKNWFDSVRNMKWPR
jgi:hypothetical protein